MRNKKELEQRCEELTKLMEVDSKAQERLKTVFAGRWAERNAILWVLSGSQRKEKETTNENP